MLYECTYSFTYNNYINILIICACVYVCNCINVCVYIFIYI